MFDYVNITEEMKIAARKESEKREPDIGHHFEVKHLDYEKRNEIGFLGEFAACEFLGINWKDNIRSNYKTIDNGDGICNKGVFDIKTETVPGKCFYKILNKTIKDNETYGRRLINKNQKELLNKYDIVIFGMFKRGDYSKWYPIGWLETNRIIENYSVTKLRPDGKGNYPEPALPIKTSELKSIEELKVNRKIKMTVR